MALSKHKRIISFEVDETFEKFIIHRSGCMGVSQSEMIRNAILFDALIDGDGAAFEIVGKKVREKSQALLQSYARKLGIA